MEKKNLKGIRVLQDPKLNKGTGFTETEREKYHLHGLLPARVNSTKFQEKRALTSLRRKASDIERYIYLVSLQDRDEGLFYRVLINNIDEIMPLIYTPTVGQACQEFDQIFRRPRGFYVTPNDRGQIRKILNNWPEKDIRMIVVTDGERILGLGDLGANGMGIPIGKLALYTACAGIHPDHCLPVMLDVGTKNETLRNNPFYLGLNQPRIADDAYLSLIDEFIEAIQDAYPQALIQFEDFLTPNAFRLLNIYRDKVLCFNDDMQGTAAVALAGIYASTYISRLAFKDLRIMFLGAGSAATGIANLVEVALCQAGLNKEEARKRLWLIDRAGLLVKNRERPPAPINQPYAHDHPPMEFIEALKTIKPHILIGATGTSGSFTEEVVSIMSEINERPGIFALSNPTSKAECTADQAYTWSDGRAIFTSGSPFDSVSYKEKVFNPAQGNNAYIFPGVGLGAIACSARKISDEMFLAAADALAAMVEKEDLAQGAIYPPLKDIRKASLNIAVAVAEMAYKQNLAQKPYPADLTKMIAEQMYDPTQ